MGRCKVLSRADIESLIAAGGVIVINDGNVLRLNGWLDKHPGGRLVLQHMVGRDATDEISMAFFKDLPANDASAYRYHCPKVLRTMNRYRIGRVSGPWINFTPPIRGGKFSSKAHNGSSNALETPSVHAEALSKFFHGEASASESEDPSSSTPPCTTLPKHGAGTLRSPPAEPNNAKVVRQALEDDIAQYPSLDATTQQAIVQKYRELHDRVKKEGFYECRYREYVKELVQHVFIFALFIVALRAEWYITSAALLGLFWVCPNARSPFKRDHAADIAQHQIMFTAHDAGHREISHNFTSAVAYRSAGGRAVITYITLSPIITQVSLAAQGPITLTMVQEHDPDIQNAPLFAMSPSFLKSFHSSYYNFTFLWDKAAEFAIPYQRYTYYPIMGIARFNLYILSWCHLLSPRSATFGAASWTRPTEICFMLCYWFLFGYCLVWRSVPTWTLRIAFVLVSHIITMPLHVQITLSHWAMSTSDVGEAESFPQHQLRTTMDVECPPWLDFIHGGLQFQAVHHLFPGVPRHNLRRLQQLVIQFSEETNIRYKRLGFVAGNKDVLGKLGEVAGQLEMMLKCQKYMAETGESGLH
ncbi:MAG: hypothetical protein Q9207_008104 [Kuettlingeria erythrocarpa]